MTNINCFISVTIKLGSRPYTGDCNMSQNKIDGFILSFIGLRTTKRTRMVNQQALT